MIVIMRTWIWLGVLLSVMVLGGCSRLPNDLTTGPEVGTQEKYYYMSGPSMEPTISNQEVMKVETGGPIVKRLERGDIVILKWPMNEAVMFAKRVIGMPGETVTVREGKVYINERVLDEPYLDSRSTAIDGERTLAKDEYYVMGDNRSNSSDSRMWGPVKQGLMVGRVVEIYEETQDIPAGVVPELMMA